MSGKYEKLKKDLRYCENLIEENSCDNCDYRSDRNCIPKLMKQAADAIETLSKEVDELKSKREWIPVTERLPIGGDKSGKICENVWLLFDDGEVYPGWMNGLTDRVYYLNERDDHVIKAPSSRVIMWQPKPEPPEEVES